MTRELAWKDTFVEKLVQEITDESCDGSSVLLDTDYNYIALELTEEQWTILYSALKTGADLSYGDTSHEVVWWWLKGVECAMSFCAKMIECIETDEDTREALIQGIIAELLIDPVQAEAFRSAMGQIGVGLSGATTQIGEPNEPLAIREFGDCDDLDVLYGQIYSWVVALSEISLDVIEWLELATNDEELASLLVDNIPAIGAIPASVLETALWLQETVGEVFQSADDTTTREYWACQIFCKVTSETCELNFENVHNAYVVALTDFSPPDFGEDLATWLNWYVSLVTLDEIEIVGAMHLFVMTVLERLGVIFGSTWRTIEIALAGSDPIENDCGDCACSAPTSFINWNNTSNFDNYPTTDFRGIYNFPPNTAVKSLATGNTSTGILYWHWYGLGADCSYNWLSFSAFYNHAGSPTNHDITVRFYRDSGFTDLISTNTVNIVDDVGTDFNFELNDTVDGDTEYWVQFEVTPEAGGYGFYISPITLSTEEL